MKEEEYSLRRIRFRIAYGSVWGDRRGMTNRRLFLPYASLYSQSPTLAFKVIMYVFNGDSVVKLSTATFRATAMTVVTTAGNPHISYT